MVTFHLSDLNDNFVLPQKTLEHKFIGSDVIMTSLTIIPSPRSEILAWDLQILAVVENAENLII